MASRSRVVRYLDSPDETNYYYSTVLRLVVELYQHGRPVVFSGAVHPVRRESLAMRADVSAIHSLALACGRDVHEARLRGRGVQPLDDAYFAPSLDRLQKNASTTRPSMDLLDRVRAHLEAS
jgi:hypothetical protein